MHCFGEKLIPVADQSVNIDDTDLDRPEPPAASFVMEISRLVRRADENALPRFDYLLAAVPGAIAFDGAGNESLERGSLRLVEPRHFGDLDQPFPIEVLSNVTRMGM
jgi:hypothetical protein